MKQNTTKQREAISTIWQLFRDYFEEGSGSLRSNDDELIEQLDIYAREEETKSPKEVKSELEDFVRWYWREVQGKPYSCTAEEIVNTFKAEG